METFPCIETSNGQVRMSFQQIPDAIHQRKLPYFVGHIGAHPSLLSPLADANVSADKLTKMVALSQIELIQQSHALHHQNIRR